MYTKRKLGRGWKKAAQWEEERKNREGRSGGEEGREGDAAGEWVEAPINLNLKDVRRGRHETQPALERGERGAGRGKRWMRGGKKRVWKWDERVKRHHCRSTVHLLIRSGRVVFLPEPPEIKRMKGGEKKRRLLCCAFLFHFHFFCLLPTCEVRSVWERSKLSTSHARRTHSVRRVWAASNIHCYFQRPPGVESRFTGCFTWSWGSIQRRWSLRFSVYCCCTSVPSAVL